MSGEKDFDAVKYMGQHRMAFAELNNMYVYDGKDIDSVMKGSAIHGLRRNQYCHGKTHLWYNRIKLKTGLRAKVVRENVREGQATLRRRGLNCRQKSAEGDADREESENMVGSHCFWTFVCGLLTDRMKMSFRYLLRPLQPQEKAREYCCNRICGSSTPVGLRYIRNADTESAGG